MFLIPFCTNLMLRKFKFVTRVDAVVCCRRLCGAAASGDDRAPGPHLQLPLLPPLSPRHAGRHRRR